MAKPAPDQQIAVVELEGSPVERGRAHGEQLRDPIHGGIERWSEVVASLTGRHVDDLIAAFLGETRFEQAMAQHTPALLEELRGIADGAGVPYATLLTYNLPDEMWLWALDHGHALMTTGTAIGCSVTVLAAEGDRPAIFAQTIDLPAHYAGTEALLAIRSGDQPDVFVLTIAGVIGAIGCNDAGLGLCGNTLLPLAHSHTGLPVACVVRTTLEQPDLKSAVSLLRRVPHASGMNYVVGDATGITGLECSSERVVEYGEGSSRIAHTNHPLVSASVRPDYEELDQPSSDCRLAFLEAGLPDATGAADLQALLSDATVPISKVGHEPSDNMTWASIVMALSRPPVLDVAVGPPSENGYRRAWPPT
jgi:isopenicillin-N N-acyltransferase-like protein